MRKGCDTMSPSHIVAVPHGIRAKTFTGALQRLHRILRNVSTIYARFLSSIVCDTHS